MVVKPMSLFTLMMRDRAARVGLAHHPSLGRNVFAPRMPHISSSHLLRAGRQSGERLARGHEGSRSGATLGTVHRGARSQKIPTAPGAAGTPRPILLATAVPLVADSMWVRRPPVRRRPGRGRLWGSTIHEHTEAMRDRGRRDRAETRRARGRQRKTGSPSVIREALQLDEFDHRELQRQEDHHEQRAHAGASYPIALSLVPRVGWAEGICEASVRTATRGPRRHPSRRTPSRAPASPTPSASAPS